MQRWRQLWIAIAAAGVILIFAIAFYILTSAPQRYVVECRMNPGYGSFRYTTTQSPDVNVACPSDPGAP